MEQAPNHAYDPAGFADLCPNGTNLDAGSVTLDDRRSEPRIETRASVVITPLATVTTRFEGSIINVSDGGLRVHLDAQLKQLPRAGEVYRVQTQDDVMLCEVRNAEVVGAGAELGLQIVHWADAGKLKRLVQHKLRNAGKKGI